MPNSGLGPNAHDDLKTTLSKIDSDNVAVSSKYNPRWDQNRHDRIGSKLDLKYTLGPNGSNEVVDENSRNEVENELTSLGHVDARERQDMYRFVV